MDLTFEIKMKLYEKEYPNVRYDWDYFGPTVITEVIEEWWKKTGSEQYKNKLFVNKETYEAFQALKTLHFKYFTTSKRANVLHAFKEKPERKEDSFFFTRDPYDMIIVDHICIDFITDDWEHRTFYSIKDYFERLVMI